MPSSSELIASSSAFLLFYFLLKFKADRPRTPMPSQVFSCIFLGIGRFSVSLSFTKEVALCNWQIPVFREGFFLLLFFFSVLVKYLNLSYAVKFKGSLRITLSCECLFRGVWGFLCFIWGDGVYFFCFLLPYSVLFLDHYWSRIAGESTEMSGLCSVHWNWDSSKKVEVRMFWWVILLNRSVQLLLRWGGRGECWAADLVTARLNPPLCWLRHGLVAAD